MSYNYFAATLPMLKFDGEPPMTLGKFVEECSGKLSSSDFRTLRCLLYGGSTDNSFVAAWRGRETQVRNAVARIRASRLGLGDSSKWERPFEGFSCAAEAGVAAAFQEKDPAAREKALDKVLWDTADELAGFDPFCAEAIFSYALKLGICERRAAADAAAGAARLEASVG